MKKYCSERNLSYLSQKKLTPSNSKTNQYKTLVRNGQSSLQVREKSAKNFSDVIKEVKSESVQTISLSHLEEKMALKR